MANCSNSSSFLNSLSPIDLSDTVSYYRFTYILCFVWFLVSFLIYILSHYSLWYVWISGRHLPFIFLLQNCLAYYHVFSFRYEVENQLIRFGEKSTCWLHMDSIEIAILFGDSQHFNFNYNGISLYLFIFFNI